MNKDNVNKNHKLAGWIDDFVSTFASKNTESVINTETETKTAEININDLDKVTWNDETFYVYFDESGAAIINGFGNTVTTMPNIKTLDEVNQKLNEKQIVSEVNNDKMEIDALLENEIESALNNITESIIVASEEDDKKAEDYINNDPNSNQIQNPAEQQPQVMASVEIDKFKARIAELESELEKCSQSQPIELIASGLQDFDPSKKTAELLNAKFAEFENTLNEKLAATVEQIYARINPGNIYDLAEKIVQEEIAKFTQEATETAEQINQENSIDGTTLEGKYTVNKTTVITPDVIVNEVVINEDNSENDDEIDNEIDEVVNEPIDNEDEEEIIGEDAEIFKSASCPYCRSTLAKTGLKNNFAKVSCGGCGVKYKVNLNDGKIYLK